MSRGASGALKCLRDLRTKKWAFLAGIRSQETGASEQGKGDEVRET